MNDPLTPETNIDTPPATASPQNKKKSSVLVVVIVIAVVLVTAALAYLIYESNNSGQSKDDSKTAQIQPAAVSVTTDGFVPATIKIKKGQTVVWTNTDTAPHQVVSGPYPQEDGLAGFVAQTPAQKNETFGFTFDRSGTFPYHDRLNPDTLKGIVIVE